MSDSFKDAALEYHRLPQPGKIAIKATKALATQRDLSLAYSPGVAHACTEIADDPLKALDYTSRGNIVAVISNGTAVLGLGNIGALASKPVMEGKAVLFKKFANIDSIDLEVAEEDPDRFIATVASLEPSFGGINLEDIKAPECFYIEEELKKRMNIPVFHDDQHGTAIIVGAAFLNWLKLKGRKAQDVRLVCNGAGASALSCLNILVEAGLPRENILVCDRKGVIYEGREESMDPYKARFAARTDKRTLGEAIDGADIFLGLSGPGALSKEDAAKMNPAPLIMALANPTPEIMPEEAREVQPEAVIATGRSDYPNQINNVLCFPYIFRGALDAGAREINEAMKLACVHAIAELAQAEATAEVAAVYADEHLSFGPDYLIPKPFDPRLIVELPVAVARAAEQTGVAACPVQDYDAYYDRLSLYVYKTHLIMRPVFDRAKSDPKRVVYTDGEDERVLRGVQSVLDEGLSRPVIIGRREVVETRIKRLNLRMRAEQDFELVDPQRDPRYKDYWTSYHQIMERRGVTPAQARTVMRTNTTAIAALMLRKGEADAMICGLEGQFHRHQKDIDDIIGLKPGVETAAALNVLVMNRGTYFICDTHVNYDPSAAQIAEMTCLAAEEVRRFGIHPKVALLSHSNFGTRDNPSAEKMRQGLKLINDKAPEIEIDGEMQADAALNEEIRKVLMPNARLSGAANLFIMPCADTANISFNILKALSDAISIGPILLGAAKPAYILTPSSSARGVMNLSALASVAAQVYDSNSQQAVDN